MQKHIGTFFLTLTFGLLTTSCAVLKERVPASESNTALVDIYNEINAARVFVKSDSLSCKKTFENLYVKIFSLAGVDSYFETADLKTIDRDIQMSFETRIALKDSISQFTLRNSDDEACLAQVQDLFKSIRYIEDYLIEARMDKTPNAPEDYVSLVGNFPYLLVNPKYARDFKRIDDFKSGDVILSRGNAFSSAAIARIAVRDYQFSHLSFVYRDQETKELFTSEAHIEIGSVVAPFQAHINEKNARSVVFRYNDEKVAHLASKAMYDRVKKYQETGHNIEYDFSMNYRDDSRLFCSEIISYGFKAALPESDYFPLYKSKLTPGVIPFLNTIGVPVSKENVGTYDVFAPGDIQFDPRFDLVAEWRNPKKLEESRFKDFILTMMFERMDRLGYKIDPSFKMDAQSKTLWLLRRTPLVRQFLEKKFALNMNPDQLQLFMAIDKIGDAIYKNLEMRSTEYDHQMTPKEILAAIDEFMSKDYSQYKNYKLGQNVEKPLFHNLFHP